MPTQADRSTPGFPTHFNYYLGKRVYQLLADSVLVLHFLFIAFVLGGGLLALRWPRVLWLHVPAVAWAVVVESMGWICPLTPLENQLRMLAGGGAYTGSFIERYCLPLIYPAGLTAQIQWMIAGLVLVVNGVIYAWLLRKYRQRH